MGELYSIIIVAGGRGSRFGSSTPKQFLHLTGTPILSVTVQAFLTAYPLIEIIVILPKEQLAYGKQLLQHFPNVQITEGGSERFYSVQNGLALVSSNKTIIGIHDGVRPLVKTEVIFDCFEQAEKQNAVIPVLPVEDSLRKIEQNTSVHVNRNDYVRIQTPQCFTTNILKNAYNVDYSPLFTDDASVVEASGTNIHFVKGNKENIKITTPIDLQLAEFYFNHLNNKNKEQ